MALWPRLSHLRIDYMMLASVETTFLSAEAYRALMLLVSYSAAGLVWTYTPPGDGSLPDDDKMLASIARMDIRKWRRVRSEVQPFFVVKRGKWHLDREWIAIDEQSLRFAIPRAVQERVRSRQGKACTYCGCRKGPFDFDHILPVSKGGSNDPSNLTLACASCNRSKGGKTLAEWIAWKSRGSPEPGRS